MTGQIIKKINKEEAEYYCVRQEDDFFDRKSADIKGAKLQEIAVAFANGEGGAIVVGVEDEKVGGANLDRWRGKEKVEEYNSLIQCLVDLNPGIDFRHHFLYTDGYIAGYVLHVEILKSRVVHETQKKEVFQRRGAQSMKISGIKIQELMRAKGMTSEEEVPLCGIRAEQVVDSRHLKHFLENLPLTDKEPLTFLIQEGLLREDTFEPTVASILLFSENPSSLLPKQCAVKIVRYDSSEDDVDRDSLTDDRHTIEGPLYDLILKSFDKLKEVLTRSHSWTLDGLTDNKYPDEALWEVLVNSVLHRDYGVSDNVLISVFRNRVEFRSPGRLPGYVTPENILTNRYSRNSKIVRFLARYPNSPNKDLGEGVNTVFDRMHQAGFVMPKISDKDSCVTVTLRREPNRDHGGVICDFIKAAGSINNRQALDLLGLDRAEQVTTLFGTLRAKGIIKRQDEAQTGTKVRWVLA